LKRLALRFQSGGLLLPGLAMLFVFFVIPMLVLVRMSFLKYDQVLLYIDMGTFDNYRKFLADSYFFKMIWDSLCVGAWTTVCSLILGYPVAYYLARIRGIERTILSCVCLLPIFVTILVTTLGWYIILLPYGATQKLLALLGLWEGRLNWLQTFPSLIAVLVHLHVPFAILILASSIQNISEEKVNAARILGASTFQVFRRIIIPLTMPAIVSSAILVFALAISSYLIPILITGQKIRLLPMAIFSYTTELLNWPFSSVIALVLLVIVSVATFLITVVTNRVTGRGKWEEV
jgi:ABC-type spermidine/putrescine transport system permease subunit I